MVDVDSVRRMSRFSRLGPEAHEWLAARLVRKAFERGELLFVEGEDAAHLYLVERGAVKVFRSLDSGRELIVGLFRPGDGVGEVALIDGGGFPASAAAHEDVSVLLLRRADYLAYLSDFEGAALALLRDVMLRMRALQRRLEDLGGGSVEYRLGRVLQTLCAGSGDADERIYAALPVTRQDLADMVGARVETVIRIVSRWQKEGLIGSDSRGLWVRDERTRDGLARGD